MAATSSARKRRAEEKHEDSINLLVDAVERLRRDDPGAAAEAAIEAVEKFCPGHWYVLDVGGYLVGPFRQLRSVQTYRRRMRNLFPGTVKLMTPLVPPGSEFEATLRASLRAEIEEFRRGR